MVKQEVTGHRPLEYSQWHRENLPHYCYCTDLDMIEWRDGRGIVAVMEIKMRSARFTRFQLKVMLELGERLDIPTYLVRYYPEDKKFSVQRLWPEPSLMVHGKTMTEEEYADFIKNL